MAIYNSNSVNVSVGSAEVVGNDTNFNTYVSVGYVFKLTNESVWYEVAAINSATNLTLTSRYSNTNYRTSRSENLASINTATKVYSGTLSNTPVIQDYVVINASIEEFTDNGGGVLTGDGTPAGSGTIDYDTGNYTVTLGTDLTATANMTASYFSGNTRSAIPYQIIRDYTSNYNLPEMGLNDTHFPYIYTKAIRLIDTAIANVSASTGSNSASIDDLQTTVANNSASIDALQTYITTTYVKIGSIYLFSGTVTTDSSASIVAAAQAIVQPVPKGSAFYNASPVGIWSFTATVTATKV